MKSILTPIVLTISKIIFKPVLSQLMVLAVFVMSGLVPAAARAQADSKFPEQADMLMKEYVHDKLFTGTVLVARDGKPIFRRAYGAANREWMIPNTVNTRYRIGSITKQFTAAAILRLADENKLGLDDPIKKILPGLPANWEQATIRQLLSHTSGIPSHTSQEDSNAKLMPVKHTPQELVDLLKDLPLNYEHGTKFRYNNMAYVLLGRIIETVSGMSYADYLEKKLLKALNLRNSGYDDGSVVVRQMSQDYTDGVDNVMKGRLVNMSNVYAAGAMYSTVDDLLAWQQVLLNGKVLSPLSLKAMFADAGHRYGLGWFVSESLSRKRYSHGGSIGAYSSLLAFYPDDKLTIIILSNYGEEVVSKITDELARLALGVAPAHRKVKVDPRLYAGFVGRYQLESVIFDITAKGDRLFAKLTGQRQLEIFPESEYRYFYKAADAVLTFEKDAVGKIDALTLHQDGSKLRAKRLD
ncbi:serine hydrolase [Telluria aromaticivorans]|uniref:Serine hydrolase n=1 Tax=Telluria aromaticivorans TaxID=2725995 RepID=A0A7Y2NZK7_9BURK|nr:serine hydrolase [Telluria aromaticivorans]NNG23184.1 serine hydrolase [Telluria aromaticivorans]